MEAEERILAMITTTDICLREILSEHVKHYRNLTSFTTAIPDFTNKVSWLRMGSYAWQDWIILNLWLL